MSAKILAFAPYVTNIKGLIEKNLRLSINDKTGDVEGYYTGFEDDSMFNNVLSHTTCIPYFRYFDKDQYLRRQYFDVIRALGLKKMWVMTEMMDNCIDEEHPDFDDFLKELDKINYSDGTKGFQSFNIKNFEYDEKGFCTNYYSAYHDTFDDLFQEVADIEKKYDVIVLGLNKYENNYIRVIKGNNLNVEFLNPETGEINLVCPSVKKS